MAHEAMQESPSGRQSEVGAHGEARGIDVAASIAAIEVGAPTPVLTTALSERLSSQGSADFGDRVQSAMRKQFGGHDEKAK